MKTEKQIRTELERLKIIVDANAGCAKGSPGQQAYQEAYAMVNCLEWVLGI
jgi:hypothetical protein